MVKIEAETLEDAYAKAAHHLTCSVTELQIEVIQHPAKGLFGFFKKRAIIVATSKNLPETAESPAEPSKAEESASASETEESSNVLNETILPASFVTGQDDEDDNAREASYKHTDASEGFFDEDADNLSIVEEVKADINELFKHGCFKIDPVDVSLYDENTLLVEFSGEDAALLIGKEGYRYKALSYMIFNWINAKYQMQLRLEIAEFLKNQEESVGRYLVSVCENVERDGRAQTKILDGVLVQIALKQLRARYPEKYVAIRSTRDGAKFIIVNHYNEY